MNDDPEYPVLFDRYHYKLGTDYESYLFSGHFINNENEREDVLIFKEHECNVGCDICITKTDKTNLNKFVIGRLDCKIMNSFHYIIYKKFEYTLATFVDSDDYNGKFLKKIFNDIVDGVNRLHKYKKFLFNINPDVIIVTKENETFNGRILDVFTSRLDPRKVIIPVSENDDAFSYCAPELITCQINEEIFEGCPIKVDTFSIAICIYYAYTKFNPFEKNNSNTYENILDKNFELYIKAIAHLNFISEQMKVFLIDLLQSMLKFCPEERISLLNVPHHPFAWKEYEIINFFKENRQKIKLLNSEEINDSRIILEKAEKKWENYINDDNKGIDCDENFINFVLNAYPYFLFDLWKNDSL